MTFATPYHAFVALAELDRLHAQCIKEFSRLSEQRATEKAHEQKTISESAAAHKKIVEQRRFLAQKEQEILQLKNKRDRVIAQSDRAVSVRERQSLEKEAALLDEQIDQEETNGLQLLDHVEREEALWPTIKNQYDEQIAAIHALNEAHDAACDVLKKRLEEQIRDRSVIEHAVESELRARYAALYARDPVPAVPVVENRCGGCHTILTMNELAQLRRHVVVSCPECYKLLYSPV
jgi:predicted  nucleic acid-binding Zn-ribbon protein